MLGHHLVQKIRSGTYTARQCRGFNPHLSPAADRRTVAHRQILSKHFLLCGWCERKFRDRLKVAVITSRMESIVRSWFVATTCGDTNLVRFFLGIRECCGIINHHNVKSNCSLLNVPNGVDEWQRT
jgi:hypothetical protein